MNLILSNSVKGGSEPWEQQMTRQFTPADLIATEAIEGLLPWFVTGRLTAVEQRLVATRMEVNPAFSAQVVLAIAERDATVSANERALPNSTAGLSVYGW